VLFRSRAFTQNPIGAANELKASYLAKQESVNSKADKDIVNWNAKKKAAGSDQLQVMNDAYNRAKMINSMMNTDTLSGSDKANTWNSAMKQKEELIKSGDIGLAAWNAVNAGKSKERFSAEVSGVSQYDEELIKAGIKSAGNILTTSNKPKDIATQVRERVTSLIPQAFMSANPLLFAPAAAAAALIHKRVFSPNDISGYISRKFKVGAETEAGQTSFANAILAEDAYKDKQLLKAISASGMTIAEAQTNARAYISAIDKRAISVTGMKFANLANQAFKDAGISEEGRKFLSSPVGSGYKLSDEDINKIASTYGGRDILNRDKKDQGKLIADVLGIVNNKVEDGTDKNGKFREMRKGEDKKDYLLEKIAFTLTQTKERDASQGRSVDVANAPPILNYWNNKW
jgi:hypothetical protein